MIKIETSNNIPVIPLLPKMFVTLLTCPEYVSTGWFFFSFIRC